MKHILFLLTFIIIFSSYSQINIITKNTLTINHGDITLYLDNDTTTLVSKHVITYNNFKNIGKYDRCDCWYQDTYNGKYIKDKFKKTGFDMGHLTPSSITSYDSIVNKNSFSMFNEAPQYAYFNRNPWKELEMDVEDSLAKYKKDAIIITGVIYNENQKKYLPNSKIKIPTHFYKILIINKLIYVWLGANVEDKKKCIVSQVNLFDLNKLILSNKMELIIK